MKKIVLLLLVVVSCKNVSDKKETEPEQQSVAIESYAVEFGNYLKNGDSIVFDINLAMEHYIRNDILTLTKKNGDISVNATIIHGEFNMEEEYDTLEVAEKKYVTDSLTLENLIRQNMHRRDKKGHRNPYLVKVYSSSSQDTLFLYSYNLADKASFIKDYFQTTKEVFPKEKAYTLEKGVPFPYLR